MFQTTNQYLYMRYHEYILLILSTSDSGQQNLPFLLVTSTLFSIIGIGSRNGAIQILHILGRFECDSIREVP
jgi:hypothetical protein